MPTNPADSADSEEPPDLFLKLFDGYGIVPHDIGYGDNSLVDGRTVHSFVRQDRRNKKYPEKVQEKILESMRHDKYILNERLNRGLPQNERSVISTWQGLALWFSDLDKITQSFLVAMNEEEWAFIVQYTPPRNRQQVSTTLFLSPLSEKFSNLYRHKNNLSNIFDDFGTENEIEKPASLKNIKKASEKGPFKINENYGVFPVPDFHPQVFQNKQSHQQTESHQSPQYQQPSKRDPKIEAMLFG